MPLPPHTAGTPRPLRKFGDPLAYYEKHYAGLTRGRLEKRDPALYNRLRKDGLLTAIPGRGKRVFADPLRYYEEHYSGITRRELNCSGSHSKCGGRTMDALLGSD